MEDDVRALERVAREERGRLLEADDMPGATGRRPSALWPDETTHFMTVAPQPAYEILTDETAGTGHDSDHDPVVLSPAWLF